MIKTIIHELKKHLPFTIFGALTGIIFLMIFKDLPHDKAHNLFYVFHPLHICFSAIVTTAMYKKHLKNKAQSIIGILKIFIIGYVGAVGIGTLSDSIVPFLGEKLLEMPHSHMHIGFIEKWWLINPLVIVSIIFAYYKPTTKLPHTGHVLISTWASLFHIIMAKGDQISSYFGVFIFLFLAVWFPCCLSDIVFPLIFTNKK